MVISRARMVPLYPLLLLVSVQLALVAEDVSTPELRADFLFRKQTERSVSEVVEWCKRISIGDPHKYVTPNLLAHLAVGSEPAEIEAGLRFLSETDLWKDNSGGLYHFAAFTKARLYFQFRERIPPDVLQNLQDNVGRHLGKFRAGGTENHRMMSRLTGLLFSEAFPDLNSRREEHLEYFREFLRKECRKLYQIGQGEWDSSTYLPFTLSSWLNVRDFSQDPLCRDYAQAAVDWYAAAMAVKYFHGVMTGPESRGFAREPVRTNADIVGWMWWGGAPEGVEDALSSRKVSHAMVPALSDYRPHPLISKLARKNVELPFEVFASKPAYYGEGLENANVFQEVGYYTDSFSMGTLYDPMPGITDQGTIWAQTTQFKLCLRVGDTVRVMGVGNPYHNEFPVQGRSPYDQFHQSKGTLISVSIIPDDYETLSDISQQRTVKECWLAVPEGVEVMGRRGKWVFFQGGDTYVAAYALGTAAEPADVTEWAERVVRSGQDPAKRIRKADPEIYRWLKTTGAQCGWILDTAPVKDYPSFRSFAEEVTGRPRVQLDSFLTEQTLAYHSLYGERLTLRHTGGPGGKPDAWVDGVKRIFKNWPVYQSPYIHQEVNSGVLRVTDGDYFLIVDVSGERPSWSQGRQ